jgi:hypothetical protein
MRTRFNSEEYELNIKEVRFLGGLSDDLTESITVMIPIEQISHQMIEDLDVICRKHKGKHKLKVQFLDATNRQTLHLFSPDKKVNANGDFIVDIEKHGLRYKVN